MAKKLPSNIGLIAILSIAFVSMAFTATTPAMNALIARFGAEVGQNISLLSNGHILTLVPVTLLSGWLTNSGKLKFKTATLIGSLLMFAGGIAPALLGNSASFVVIIACKLIFGVGLGLLTPLANALILNHYEGNKQARYLGWVALLMNFGGILFQMLGGILADATGANGWYMHFWAYALCFPPIILAFFIPEPEMHVPSAAEASGPKEKMGSIVIVAGVVLFLINLFNFPVMMYMSALFAERGIGGEAAATTAATALSMFTVAGVVAGAIYGTMFRLLKRFILPVGFFLMAIGAVLLFFAQNAIIATIGAIFLGFAFSLVMPSFMSLVGMNTPPSRATMATSIVLAIMNLGALAVTPYLSVLAGFAPSPLALYELIILIEIVGFTAIGVLFLFWNLYPKAVGGPAPTEIPGDGE